MHTQSMHPLFQPATTSDLAPGIDTNQKFLTELFFETIISFDLAIELEDGTLVDNHAEDSPDLAPQVALIAEFIAKGALLETVLARLAIRKSEAAHLLANMVRRQASLPTKSLRDLVLLSLNHRKSSPVLSRSEAVYLQRAEVIDTKRGGLTPKGQAYYQTDESVQDAAAGHRLFKKPKCKTRLKNAWMKFCPI